MSFSRVNPPGWAVGDRFTSAQANALDIDHANALDKTVAGDTILGNVAIGAGAQISLPTATSAVNLTGNGASVNASGNGSLIQATAAGALIRSFTGGRFQYGDNDFTLLAAGHTGSSRTIVVPCNLCPLAVSGGTTFGTSGGGTTVVATPNTPQYAGSGALLTTAVSGAAGLPYMYLLPLPPGALHQGATLSSVVLRFVPATSHTNVPAAGDITGFTVWRTAIGAAGDAWTSINHEASLGAAQYTPPTLTVWNNGQIKTLTLSPSSNNVIDKTQYSYYVSLYDECNTNAVAGTHFLDVALVYSSIADTRFQ